MKQVGADVRRLKFFPRSWLHRAICSFCNRIGNHFSLSLRVRGTKQSTPIAFPHARHPAVNDGVS